MHSRHHDAGMTRAGLHRFDVLALPAGLLGIDQPGRIEITSSAVI